jgi:hypothetical protein
MAAGEASERVILQLRAVLRGISPLIWRLRAPERSPAATQSIEPLFFDFLHSAETHTRALSGAASCTQNHPAR